MRKTLLLIALMILILPVVYSIIDCKGVMTKGELPCILISSWSFDCSSNSVTIYNEVPRFLRNASLDKYGNTSYCNLTFGKATNETAIGSYFFNWTTGDSSKIIVKEDNDMLIAFVIGISLIVALFVFLTFATKEDKPFLANFFFMGIWIFSTVLTNLLWKISSVNSSPYEPIFLLVYKVLLWITMLLILVVLVILTNDAVQVRKIQGNPIDNYHDNLGK